jgi:MinD-like ATPase involved in chromosome partitioning or flagellar assembly
VAALLIRIFAHYRGDRVIAADLGPAGTLGERLLAEPARRSIRDVVAELTSGVGPDLHVGRFVELAARLEVLPAEIDPTKALPLDLRTTTTLVDTLRRSYGITILDCGPGLTQPAVHAAVAAADTTVVVGTSAADGLQRLRTTLNWLVADHHTAAVQRAILVTTTSSPAGGRPAELGRLAERARAAVSLPFDPHLASGCRLDPDQLASETLLAAHELTALVAADFRWTHPARSDRTVAYTPNVAAPRPSHHSTGGGIDKCPRLACSAA